MEVIRWRWVLITAIAPIAWGSSYFVTRQFLPLDYPLWGAVLRALPAGLILLALARTLPRGSWRWKSVVLGALNVGAFFILIYVASQLLPSSIASTIMATSAAMLMLIAWPLLGERPALLSLLGAVLGFTGVGVMVMGGVGSIDPLGVAASLAAMMMSSLGFVLTKRWGSEQKVLAVTSWQLIAGGILVLPFAIIVEGNIPTMDAPAAISFAYVSIIATAIAYAAWFGGLRHLPAGTVGLVGLLNPVTGVLLGVMLASEHFGPQQALGILLVLVGMALGKKRGVRRMRQCD
ncbi:DMT family transporter [Salinibacterium sp. NK8237]|uniref:DMT family transporter n=1 Tax=Salinibacterium sp. NK8237 TaxID=2792038 RepID=UPI0018CCEF54|nr:EamA family transporter [Salinibacterium sp. NK8237]MBH0130317.1 EamA family transporter [Salinibacterium sp. NK8237]